MNCFKRTNRRYPDRSSSPCPAATFRGPRPGRLDEPLPGIVTRPFAGTDQVFEDGSRPEPSALKHHTQLPPCRLDIESNQIMLVVTDGAGLRRIQAEQQPQ